MRQDHDLVELWLYKRGTGVGGVVKSMQDCVERHSSSHTFPQRRPVLDTLTSVSKAGLTSLGPCRAGQPV